MNRKKIELINELLIEQMNHWLLFPLILTFMGVTREIAGTGEPSLLLWLLCSLLPLAFFLFRCQVKNLILLVLAHLGILALVFFLSGSNWTTRIACTVCAAGYLISSLTLRLKHHSVYSEGLSFPFGVGLSAIASLIQRYQGTHGWENYYQISLIVGIALYFVIHYIENYLDFLSKNKSSAGFLPTGEMFHSGMGLVLLYTLSGIVILLISTQFEWLAGILRPIKDLLLRFLRYLFSRGAHSAEDAPLIEQEQMQNQGGREDLVLSEGGESFWFWKVLEVVMITAFAGAALVLLFLLLRKLFRLIQRYMTLHYQEQELQSEEAFDLREKCEIEKDTRRKTKGLFSALAPRERVRRLYKKNLAAARMEKQDRDSLGLYTAREWERKLSLDGMADLYEQARYSNREITGTDVRKMKDTWK